MEHPDIEKILSTPLKFCPVKRLVCRMYVGELCIVENIPVEKMVTCIWSYAKT